MHRFFSLVVAGTTASAAAFADDHASLRGTYASTGVTSCVQDSASLGFNPNFTPKGPAVLTSTTHQGVRVFHADGTGTVNDQSISVTAPPFSAALRRSLVPVHLHDRPRWQTVDRAGAGHVQGHAPDRPGRRADGSRRDSSLDRIHRRGRADDRAGRGCADRRTRDRFQWRPVRQGLHSLAHPDPHQRRRTLILVNGGAEAA
jgi:hypothetical protein